MSQYRYEIFEGEDGQWYWRLKSSNNRIVAQSEGYTRKYDAESAAKKLADIAIAAEDLIQTIEPTGEVS